MTSTINSKTTITQIKNFARQDFGIEITNSQAKEVKDSVRSGVAVWTGERYITTRGSDDINRMSREGVNYSAYKTFYKRSEWNAAVAEGKFN